MRVCSHCHLLLADADSVCPHDGAELRAVDVPPVPSALHDKFSNIEPFARGQTGTCYLATQKQSSYRGVLKVIPLASVEASERVRLKRELRKQTQLIHDSLTRIVDGGEIGQQVWLFREHIQGETLAQRLRRSGKLAVADALTIAAQVASGLDDLQRNGLLHRDVKPGHIVLQGALDSAPRAKLIDAGIAARLPTGSVFGLLGTPAYISPEQVAGKLVSFRSDLYALGCVLYEMLSGAPPFVEDDVQAVLEAHKSQTPAELALELPHQARSLLQALLAKEPRQRPFSAQQVRRTLEPLLPAGTQLPAIGTRAPARNQPSLRRKNASLPTEEIELEEIPMAAEGPSTLHLTDSDLDEIAVSDGPKTQHLTDQDLSELEVSDEARAAGPSSNPPARRPEPDSAAAVQASAASVRDAVTHDPDSSSNVIASSASAAPPAPRAPAASASASRRSVDFDVESLFDEDERSGAHATIRRDSAASGLHEVAPTQIFRPRGHDEGPPTHFASAPPAVPSDLSAPASADPEGTLMTARPVQRKLLPWVFAGMSLIVLFGLWGRARHREPAAVAHEVKPAPSAAPTAELPGAEHPLEPAAKREPTSSPELTAKAQPEPVPAAAQPITPQPQTTHEAESPKPVAVAAQPATATNEPAPTPSPAAAAAADGTHPAATEVTPAAAPTTSTPAAAMPAATAAGNTVTGAELSAANAAARAQTGAGDAKLAAARAPRDDRVAKADEYKTQGREAYQAGHYREAAAAYEKATEQNPSDAGAFAGLAASRLASGDANAAVQAYSRAVRLQPDSSGFHAALGRAYLQKGDRDRARSAYQHALELNPNNAAAKTALAQLK